MNTSVKKQNFFVETFKFTLIAILIVIPIRFFIAQPFIVSGASMDPTFYDGEYIIVDELSYRFSLPERGETIIFKYPRDPSKYFIKRIIGLPRETVIIDNGTITIKNDENPQGVTLTEPYVAALNSKLDTLSITLKEDEYYVLGDNRRVSSDSRAWGPVKENLIVGRPFVRLYPLRTLALFPGTYPPLK